MGRSGRRARTPLESRSRSCRATAVFHATRNPRLNRSAEALLHRERQLRQHPIIADSWEFRNSRTTPWMQRVATHILQFAMRLYLAAILIFAGAGFANATGFDKANAALAAAQRGDTDAAHRRDSAA